MSAIWTSDDTGRIILSRDRPQKKEKPVLVDLVWNDKEQCYEAAPKRS